MGNSLSLKAEIHVLEKLTHNSSHGTCGSSVGRLTNDSNAASNLEHLPTLLSTSRHVPHAEKRRELEKIRYDDKAMAYWKRSDVMSSSAAKNARMQSSSHNINGYA